MKNRAYMVVIVLLLQLIFGTVYAIATPLWQGHEADYYNVVRFLVRHQRLPTAADYPAGDAEIRQATQPPIYFLLAAPIVALMDDNQPVPYGIHPVPFCVGGERANSLLTPYVSDTAYNHPSRGTIAGAYLLRLLNVALGAVAVLFTYKIGRCISPEPSSLPLFGAAILAFEPVTQRSIVVISNDALLLALCAWILFLCVKLLTHQESSRRNLVLLIVLTGTVPLVKLPGWSMLAVTAFTLAALFISRTRNWRLPLLGIGLMLLFTVGIAFLNQLVYGGVFGRYAAIDSRAISLLQRFEVPWLVVRAIFENTISDLFAPLFILQARAVFFGAYRLLFISCCLALIVGVANFLLHNKTKLTAIAGLITAIIVTVGLVIFRNTLIANADNTTAYNTAMIFAPLRYYIPALPAAAVLLVVGFGWLLPRLTRGWLAAILPFAFGLILTGLSILLFIQNGSQKVLTQEAFAALEGVNRVSLPATEDEPEIVGYQLEQQLDAGWLDLTLYVTLSGQTELNYAAEVELANQQMVVSTCEFLPTRGEYPTLRWSPGEIVVSHARIPNCQANLPRDLQLGLSWTAYNPDGTPVKRTPANYLTRLDGVLARADTCPENLGVIADQFQLTKWNSPFEISAGELYLPSVNWLVLEATDMPLRRIFEFIAQEGDTSYTCIGSPSEGTIPINSWRRGENVYFDQCQMIFPIDAPNGTYSVMVALQEENGAYLTAVQPDGTTGSWLMAGQVTVR
ncbi:MAG: hypothetical protein IPK17_17720 [Chloroflexi bacterium]|uniref:ArnT family glycosyltransferase n=1 Tax=Candidatus Flexifilum breve TaxID=3140694 RepID=UPI003135A381|nr:hypothetical protein [Chloroflexota bacterium]